jgi:F-type H+-transporting ATPase subunit epsilon
MEDLFKIEIISPEKVIFSDDIKIVKLPSYEGDMSILKNHISIITFLRPGIIRVEKKDGNAEEFFAEEGTVEFFNNTLILLSASVENTKNLSKEFISDLSKNTQDKLNNKNISDQDSYILNHKLDVLRSMGA